jgi:hypothetical protein
MVEKLAVKDSFIPLERVMVRGFRFGSEMKTGRTPLAKLLESASCSSDPG